MANRIVVLGGGISGLSAAYYLARGFAKTKLPREIILLEKGKLGGWMQTENTGHGVFDLGPRSLRTAGFVGSNSLKLALDIGLEEKFISVTPDSSSVKSRFIYANKQLNPFPSNIREFIAPQPPLSSSMAAIYLKGFFKSAPAGSETIYDVISGRFGEEVAKYYADAFARGVFAADIKELSFKAAFPGIWYMLKPRAGTMPRKPKLPEQVYEMNEIMNDPFMSRVKSQKWSQWNLEGGLVELINALEKACLEKGVKILKNTEVKQLTLQSDQKFSVECHSEESEAQQEEEVTTLENVDHVVSTLPAHALSEILTKESDESLKLQELLQEIGSELSEIKSVDVGLVSLEYKGSPEDLLPHVGFGHLVPSCEESKVLGIVYDSCTFPEHDRKEFQTTRLTCMMGGSWFREIFGDPEQVKLHDLEIAALESVSEQLGINSEPITAIPRLHRKCIPLYRVGHTDLVEGIEDQLKSYNIPLHLGGSSYWGVSVNDCIYNSRFIADNLIDQLLPERPKETKNK